MLASGTVELDQKDSSLEGGRVVNKQGQKRLASDNPADGCSADSAAGMRRNKHTVNKGGELDLGIDRCLTTIAETWYLDCW